MYCYQQLFFFASGFNISNILEAMKKVSSYETNHEFTKHGVKKHMLLNLPLQCAFELQIVMISLSSQKT